MPVAIRKLLRLTLISSFLALSIGACSYRQEKSGPVSNGGGRSSKLSPSFAQVRDQVFIPKCISCHHHAADFSDYNRTFSERGAIEQRVFVDHSMPQGDTLSASQSALLKQWLDAGAPEQAQEDSTTSPGPIAGTPPVTPGPVPSVSPTPDPAAAMEEALATIRLNFELKIRPLVNRACVACHDSNARPEGILGHLPGIRAREWKHIRDASKIMDFSRTFPSWTPQNSNPVFYLDQIRASIQQNRMPTWDFRLAHHLDGRLLRFWEKQIVIDWTVDSERLIAQADATRPTTAKIIQNRCLGCHNTETHAAGLIFEFAGNEFKIPQGNASGAIPYVTAGSPETSAIYLVLLTEVAARKGLSPMPRNSDPLSVQDRDVVYDWIKALR